jgi:hypothetical protein
MFKELIIFKINSAKIQKKGRKFAAVIALEE